jgi:hypothetical protein
MSVFDTFPESSDARDILINSLRQFFGTSAQDAQLVAQLSQFIDREVTSGRSFEEININIRQTDAWKQRFSGNEALRAAGLPELDVSSYLAAEKSYTEILNRAGLNNLANRNNFSQLIGGAVSAAELADRVVGVYDRIRFADDALAKELQGLKTAAGLSDADLAESLLLGKEGTDVLKRKISMAEITSESSRRGITSALGAEELLNLGVDRSTAAKGFETVRQAQQPLASLANIYGVSTEGLQAELETEQFTGLESQRRKQLSRQELAAFSGESGTAGISLDNRRQGRI